MFLPPTENSPRGFILPFTLWMAGQLAVLVLAAANVTLIRDRAASTESWATLLLVLAQLVLASALWADLLATWRAALLAASGGMPMLALAGVLTGQGYRITLLAAAVSLLWMAGLFVWRQSLPRRWHVWASSLVLLWMLGGLAMSYVQAEFNLPPGERGFAPSVAASPLLAALQVLAGAGHSLAWLVIGAPLLAALPLALWRSRMSRARYCTAAARAS